MKKIEKIQVDPTQKIFVEDLKTDVERIEDELRKMTKEDLLRKLNFEETDPKIIKIIKKIIKEK